MKRALIAVALVMLLVAVALQSQTPAPKPGPEHQRLGYLVGTWKLEGERKTNPSGAGGKITGTITCSLFEGGFHRVCQSTIQNPSGTFKGMNITLWNPEEKVYKKHDISSDGTTTESRITLSKNTWIETYDRRLEGKIYHWRWTSVETSPTELTQKAEYSEDGKTWIATHERKWTKQWLLPSEIKAPEK